MGRDKVPVLDGKTIYSDWKKRVDWWQQATSVSPEARAATLIMHMSGKPEEVAIQLNSATLSVDGGVKLLIAELDKLYEKDQTQSIFTAIDSFITYRRPKDMSMEEYIREFSQRHKNLVQRRGKDVIFEDGILAYFLLHHANLSETQKTLIRATISDLSYSKMEEQLKRAYGEECCGKKSSSSSSSSSCGSNSYSLRTPDTNVKVKEEPVYFQQFEPVYDRDEYSDHQSELMPQTDSEYEEQTYYLDQPEDPNDEVFYQQPGPVFRQRPRSFYQRPYRGGASRGGQRPAFYGGYQGQRPQMYYPTNSQRPPSFRQVPTAIARPAAGAGPLRCHICKDPGHLVKDCKYNTFGEKKKKPDNKMTYFESEFQLEDEEESLIHLMGESTNKALLDTGASSTVCGKKWLTIFEESLTPEERQEIEVMECSKTFRFGDGDEVVARTQKKLPVTICGQDSFLAVYVVDNDIPLLLSRESMKRMRMKIDSEHDKVYALDGEDDLLITKTGHMVIPIGRCDTSQAVKSKESHQELTYLLDVKDSNSCAKHLHRYFAHGSTTKLAKFVQTMNLPNEKDIIQALKNIEKECQFCLQHKSREVPHRKVAVPMGNKFNDVLAMDLKMLNCGEWIIHMIDPVTRYAGASAIKSKEAEEIITKIFDKWISIFGRPGLVITDNGGEFVNEKFLEMCNTMNITVKTSPAESPWCNGTVERHNGVLSEMIDAVLEETGCNIDIAISWAVNAKNSLANVYGFSPHQLVYGKNPEVPGILEYKNLPALNEHTCSKILADNLNALSAARLSFIKAENSERLRRIMRERVYVGATAKYYSGDQVYYKRKNVKGPWFGPATVVGQIDNQVLIKDGGSLIRIHPCKVVLKSKADKQVTRSDQNLTKVGTFADQRRPHQKTKPFKPQKLYSSSDSESNSDEESSTQPVLASSGADSDADVESAFDEEELNMPRLEGEEEPPYLSHDSAEWEKIVPSGTKDKEKFLKLKKNDIIRFREDIGISWTRALVIGRAGKAGGVNKNKFNLQLDGGESEEPLCIDLASVEVERLKAEETPDETVMFTEEESICLVASKIPDEKKVKVAKEAEIKKFQEYNVYEEVKNTGQSTVSCRWVVTQKDDKVKARLVARGYEEMLLQRVDAPTVSSTSLWILFTLTASNKWKIRSFDVTSAFLQSNDITREVFIQPPADFRKNGILWRLKKPMYGLGDSPKQWYSTLKQHLINSGCQISKLDKTLFSFYEDNKLTGILVTHVDDVLYSGTTRFQDQIIKALFKTFKISAEHRDSFRYLGLNVSQDRETHTITVDQNDYAKSVKPVTLSTSRRTNSDADLTEEEKTSYHSVLGKLLWLSGRTRPDLSYDCMELSTYSKSPKVKDMLFLNKVVKKVQDKDSTIHFRPLDLKTDNIRVVFYSDASLGNLPNGGSSRGYVTFIANQHGNVNLMSWSSNKVKRVCHSAFAAETLGCTDGLADAVYCRQILSEILYRDPGSRVIEVYGFVDNKQLHDQISSTKQCADKRLRLDIAEIQETVNREINDIKWIQTSDMLADCLTKKGADFSKLSRVIEDGFCEAVTQF